MLSATSVEARREAVLHVLSGSAVRVSYPDLIDALEAQGDGTAGVLLVVKALQAEGVVRCEYPDGEPYRDQYGLEPGDPGYKDGPMYVNLLRAPRCSLGASEAL